MGTGDKSYIYGEANGSEYRSVEQDRLDGSGKSDGVEFKTHWDPRIEVRAIAGTIQVGIVPPSEESTRERGVWNNDDGQFLSLSRDGANRLIAAVREARIAVHGTDE